MTLSNRIVSTLLLLVFASLPINAQENSLAMSPAPLEEEFAQPWWHARHLDKLNEIEQRRGEIDVVLLGDSITHAWEDKGFEIWQREFAPRGGLNLGYGGDRTENVLWRIANGEIDNMSPRVFVILIGTNNTGHRRDPADQTAAGIEKIIAEVHARHANAQIILHALFPRGRQSTSPLRKLNNHINELIQPLSQRSYVHWLDLTALFKDENGLIPSAIMEDALHPNAEQYARWAEHLLPMIDKLRKE